MISVHCNSCLVLNNSQKDELKKFKVLDWFCPISEELNCKFDGVEFQTC
jgi:hypothetical protein